MMKTTVAIPEITALLKDRLRLLGFRNLSMEKARKINNLLTDTKKEINDYLYSTYINTGEIDDVMLPFNNIYDITDGQDDEYNRRRFLQLYYNEEQSYTLMDSMRPTFTLQAQYNDIHTMISTMNSFVESIYSIISETIHSIALPLTNEDTITWYKVYNGAKDKKNCLSYVSFYSYQLKIACSDTGIKKIPTLVTICIAPMVKKVAMFVLSTDHNDKTIKNYNKYMMNDSDMAIDPSISVYRYEDFLPIIIYDVDYSNNNDCVIKINMLIHIYMDLLRHIYKLDSNVTMQYNILKDPQESFTKFTLYNITNHLHGNIRRNGRYQYSITYDASGTFLRTISSLSGITVIGRAINNSKYVKEALDKARRFSIENNLSDQERIYRMLLAQRYNNSLSTTIRSIMERIFALAIQNVSSDYVAKCRNMKINVAISDDSIKSKSIVCNLGLYYECPDPRSTLMIRIYDPGRSDAVKDKSITKTIRSLALYKNYNDRALSLTIISKEIKEIEEIANVYRAIDNKFKLRAYRYIKTGIMDIVNYIKDHPDVFKEMFEELITAYQQFNSSLDMDTVISKAKNELSILHRQKNAILKNDVRFQKQQQVNNLTIEQIDSNVEQFLVQLNYYCDSSLNGYRIQ